MKEEEKKKSKLGTICKVAIGTLVVTGLGILAYKKIPQFKTFLDSVNPFGKNSTSNIIKTKPFRKYETFIKK